MIRRSLPGVQHVVAVASGKGGVGKTTVTVNLALALQQMGSRVGVFDADIYGPNVPLMLGIHQRRVVKEAYMPIVRPPDAEPSLKPIERFGLKLMSTGLIMGEDQSINPPPDAVGQLVVQTLNDVLWGELDILLLDLPPSAGQPQAGLLENIRLVGVVIVTTPQDLSLLDAGRSLLMFQKAHVPVLGIVENMSYFICPTCGERHDIFQRSAQWRPTSLETAPVLGRIPLTPDISQSINRAHPLVHDQPGSAQAAAFRELAAALRSKLPPAGPTAGHSPK